MGLNGAAGARFPEGRSRARPGFAPHAPAAPALLQRRRGAGAFVVPPYTIRGYSLPGEGKINTFIALDIALT